MKPVAFAFLAALAAVPFAGLARDDATNIRPWIYTWTNVPLIDEKCSAKFDWNTVDAHTRSCALVCESSGYGILTSDGKYLKFDKEGDRKALNELKAWPKKDHLRATVTGQLDGRTVIVDTIKLD